MDFYTLVVCYDQHIFFDSSKMVGDDADPWQCYLGDAKDDVYGSGQRVDGAHQFTAHNLR